MEDYLKTIYTLEKENKVARVSGISRSLAVRKASVVAAIRLLQKNLLLTHEHYGYISLTDSGRQEAEKILKKYDVLKRFLTGALGLDPEKAALEACEAEHVFSDETMAKLALLLKKPAVKIKTSKKTSRKNKTR